MKKEEFDNVVGIYCDHSPAHLDLAARKYNEFVASSAHGFAETLPYCTIALTGEAGEFAEAIKKIIRREDGSIEDPSQLSEDDRFNLAMELGDVLWYTTALARILGFSLSEIQHLNMVKLRYRKGEYNTSIDKED